MLLPKKGEGMAARRFFYQYRRIASFPVWFAGWVLLCALLAAVGSSLVMAQEETQDGIEEEGKKEAEKPKGYTFEPSFGWRMGSLHISRTTGGDEAILTSFPGHLALTIIAAMPEFLFKTWDHSDGSFSHIGITGIVEYYKFSADRQIVSSLVPGKGDEYGDSKVELDTSVRVTMKLAAPELFYRIWKPGKRAFTLGMGSGIGEATVEGNAVFAPFRRVGPDATPVSVEGRSKGATSHTMFIEVREANLPIKYGCSMGWVKFINDAFKFSASNSFCYFTYQFGLR